MKLIPDQIRGNELTKILDEVQRAYAQLSRIGRINGLVIADQDAKVLATNTHFDTRINYWDIGAIGAALFGVAKQGRDFFKAEDLERAIMLYKNTQLFVQTIGNIHLKGNRLRELILIVLADKQINIGLMNLQMQKFSKQIKEQVEQDQQSQEIMVKSEQEMVKHLNDLKKDLLSQAKTPSPVIPK